MCVCVCVCVHVCVSVCTHMHTCYTVMSFHTHTHRNRCIFTCSSSSYCRLTEKCLINNMAITSITTASTVCTHNTGELKHKIYLWFGCHMNCHKQGLNNNIHIIIGSLSVSCTLLVRSCLTAV